MRNTFLLFFSFGFLALYANTLRVYQDTAQFDYSPTSDFVGIAQEIEATCRGSSIALISKSDCNSSDRLCRLLKTIEKKDIQLQTAQNGIATLNKLVSLLQPSMGDANQTVKSAKIIAKTYTDLTTKKQKLTNQIQELQETLEKQTTAKKGLYFSTNCDTPITLNIPNQKITFTTYYQADLSTPNEINITQYLSILNSSGIDIVADEAMFYNKNTQHTIEVAHFDPWIVNQSRPILRSYDAKAIAQEVTQMMDTIAPVALMQKSVEAKMVDTRIYRVANLSLPSTATAIVAPVLTWSLPVVCKTELMPYLLPYAYQACSFSPKNPIESHQWKVTNKKETIAQNAIGEYQKGHYTLYTTIDDEIEVTREPIVEKAKESGLFGSSIRKKDGYRITLINSSNHPKALLIHDRIPNSTTDQIKVKLLSVNSEKQIKYTLSDEGNLTITLTLDAKESQSIEVLFELEYDKETQVNY